MPTRERAVAEELTGRGFVERLVLLVSPAGRADFEKALRARQRRRDADGFGIRMRDIFELAKEFIDLPPTEIDELIKSPVHEVRVGALSVMDKQARRNATPDGRREELFELYLRRSDRIDSWDLVDLGVPYVVGRYLWDKPRRVLYRLARSSSPWERRTAIVSTLYFVRKGDVQDTFGLAALLARDDHESVQKATGGLLREAGRKDVRRLRGFLEEHAAGMARTALTYATEHLTRAERDHYRSLTTSPGRGRAARKAGPGDGG
jgi:3-methyladenine DNA glycosylase AlkD